MRGDILQYKKDQMCMRRGSVKHRGFELSGLFSSSTASANNLIVFISVINVLLPSLTAVLTGLPPACQIKPESHALLVTVNMKFANAV